MPQMENSKTFSKIKNDVTSNLDPVETELLKFVELVQSTTGFFDLRFMRVVKKNNRAYFQYGTIISEVPLNIIEKAKEQARNGNL